MEVQVVQMTCLIKDLDLQISLGVLAMDWEDQSDLSWAFLELVAAAVGSVGLDRDQADIK